MPEDDSYEVDGFGFIGRTYDEYRRLFDLHDDDLVGRTILDCPSGPSSFVTEASEHVGADAHVVGVDRLYDRPVEELCHRSTAAVADVADQLSRTSHLFEWSFYGDVETRLTYLDRASRDFVVDFERHPERYVTASLPSLPFPANAFDLVLSAHFLFLYGDRLDRQFHVESLRELARVASEEVRVYPLQGLDAEPSPHLQPVREELTDGRFTTSVRTVPYEFQRGSTEMLVVSER